MSLQFLALELYRMSLHFFCYRCRCSSQCALCPCGVLVGGTRERHFDGTHFKPHKMLENAQTPTTMAPAFFAGVRVHALLGAALPFRHFVPYKLSDDSRIVPRVIALNCSNAFFEKTQKSNLYRL